MNKSAKSDLLMAIGKFGSAQLVIQAIAFVSGLLIVRMLAPEQYALYTIAGAFLGVLNVVSDGGLAYAALSEGGKVLHDPKKLGAVVVSAFALRQRLSIFVAVLASPLMAGLLFHHKAGVLETLIIIGSVLAVFYLTLSNALYQTTAKLQQRVGMIGRIRAVADMWRLILLLLTLPFMPLASVGVGVAALPQWWANRRLKHLTCRSADLRQSANTEIANRMKVVLRKALPGGLFYAIKGQIVVLLVSFFGNTMALAQVGALGRLSQIMIFFSAIATTVAVPRFARINSRKKLFKAFVATMCAGAGIVVLLLGGLSLFGEQALWLLGSSYGNLNTELLLMMTGSGIGFLTGLAYSLGASRGWIVGPVVTIVTVVLVQAAFLLVFDVSTLRGVLTYNVVTALWPLTLVSAFVCRRLICEPA